MICYGIDGSFCKTMGHHRKASSMKCRISVICAMALVFIVVAYPARAVPEKIQYSGDAKPGTDRRAQPLSRHRKRAGIQVLSRRRSLRPAMVRHHADRQQAHQAGVETTGIVAWKSLAGILYRGRFAEKSDGRRRAGAGRPRTRHPWH